MEQNGKVDSKQQNHNEDEHPLETARAGNGTQSPGPSTLTAAGSTGVWTRPIPTLGSQGGSCWPWPANARGSRLSCRGGSSFSRSFFPGTGVGSLGRLSRTSVLQTSESKRKDSARLLQGAWNLAGGQAAGGGVWNPTNGSATWHQPGGSYSWHSDRIIEAGVSPHVACKPGETAETVARVCLPPDLCGSFPKSLF